MLAEVFIKFLGDYFALLSLSAPHSVIPNLKYRFIII